MNKLQCDDLHRLESHGSDVGGVSPLLYHMEKVSGFRVGSPHSLRSFERFRLLSSFRVKD